MHHDIPEWVYVTFTAVTAGGVMMQALVLLGMLFALKGALRRLDEVSKKAEENLLPLLATSRSLLEEVSPKLKVAAQNALEVSQTVRTESVRVVSVLDDVMERAAVQVDRVDEMVTGTLDSVAQATAMVQRTVAGPVRQVSAVLNGLRAGFDVLRNKEREAHAAADGDHFV
jgi:hypothetical protein